MKKTLITLAIASLLGLFSCSSNEQKTEQPDQVESPKDVKTFTYNPEATKVIWTGYKTTQKVGVTGQFTSFEVAGTVEADNIVDVFKNASITIASNSVSTGNELRNGRIVKSYFGVFVNTDEIKANIVELSQTTGKIAVTLNDITNEIPVEVTITGNEIKLKGLIDINTFDGQEATDSLNYVCKDVHKGPDGVTKLWPDVEIMVKSALN